MKPVIDDEDAFAAQVREVVELHQAAAALAAENVRVVSCDEKTGMQALERHGRWAMKPGQPERHEAWYTRHGTLCLIANLDLATGQVVAPTLGPPRTRAAFIAHVEKTVATEVGRPARAGFTYSGAGLSPFGSTRSIVNAAGS
jgi:ABC-type tungstate transport system permease subunit